jgi:uncharacterized protein
MRPTLLLRKYYDPNSLTYRYLIEHSEQVARKALSVAERVKHLRPDLRFIEEAALLHDIGIFLTRAPEIGCHGDKPYVCHGYLGRELLEREGLPRHALVCERHLGVGISRAEIRESNLPLPERDMMPISIEEQIICFADKFYTKSPGRLDQEKSIEDIRESLSKYGPDKLRRFDDWVRLFGG